MASTTLFAPQVRDVQPAFVYKQSAQSRGEVYFSLSSFNKLDDIQAIAFTLIDPNAASGWGTNSKIALSSGVIIIPKSQISQKGSEYYFIYDFGNVSNIKSLNINQYYSMQLYLLDKDHESNINSVYDLQNSPSISEPSSITLIRPIGTPTVRWDVEAEESMNSNFITGHIEYEGGSTIEAIETYSYIIKNSSNATIYSSNIYYNSLGVNFLIELEPAFFQDIVGEENAQFKIIFSYRTINGYQDESEQVINLTRSRGTKQEWTAALRYDEDGGYVHITNIGSAARLFRASEDSGYLLWEEIPKINAEFKDYFIEAGKGYLYSLENESGTLYMEEYFIQPNFEEIFIMDENQQLAVRFNPTITNFKYVTQESITNTLGGKYPVIRRNGHTKYRQFNITGTLIFEYKEKKESQDSCGKQMVSIVLQDYSSVYVSNSAKASLENYLQNNKRIYTLLKDKPKQQKELYEKKLKDIAIQFLTNGTPKLLRAYPEGNLIVHLSNVSFTPNKMSSRSIYDFSAAVTELCENTINNRAKYGLAQRSYTSGSDIFYNCLKDEE